MKERDKMYQVVFHIDSEDKFLRLFANILNLKKEFKNNGDDYQLNIVMNGPSVTSLRDLEIADEIATLSTKKVAFMACENSLKANQIDSKLLNSNIELVNSGVYTLTVLQSLGFLYIKL